MGGLVKRFLLEKRYQAHAWRRQLQLNSARRRWVVGAFLSIYCSPGRNKELLKKPKVSLHVNTSCNFSQQVQWVREVKIS